jgi:type II secretory pathway component PulF
VSDALLRVLDTLLWGGWTLFCFLAGFLTGAAWVYRREWLRAREERGTP